MPPSAQPSEDFGFAAARIAAAQMAATQAPGRQVFVRAPYQPGHSMQNPPAVQAGHSHQPMMEPHPAFLSRGYQWVPHAPAPVPHSAATVGSSSYFVPGMMQPQLPLPLPLPPPLPAAAAAGSSSFPHSMASGFSSLPHGMPLGGGAGDFSVAGTGVGDGVAYPHMTRGVDGIPPGEAIGANARQRRRQRRGLPATSRPL